MPIDASVESVEQIADWLEVCLSVSRSGAFGLDKVAALADAHLTAATEAKVSLAMGAMGKRQQVLGSAYPFRVDDVGVVRVGGALSDTYCTLVHLSPNSIARQLTSVSDVSVMGRLFEDITEVALANFWGRGGDAISFAHPSRHGRPREFDQAVRWLAARMGLDVGNGYRPPRRQDGGVDVVAWRQFSDRRQGFPIALAQCTIQTETFTKTTDIDLRLWASWLAMDSDPLSLLAIPGTIRSAGPDWKQLSTVVMVLDRIRIMELIARGGEAPPANEWLHDVSGELSELLSGDEL